jgi:hypothetical protein
MYSSAQAPLMRDSQNCSDSDAVMYSRSAGLLSQAGNADAELKTRVSHDASDDFRRLARELGMTTSELLRVLILTRLYGVDGVARMTSDHLQRVAGIVPNKDQTPVGVAE